MLPYRESDLRENNVLYQTVDNIHEYRTPNHLERKIGLILLARAFIRKLTQY